MEEVKEATTFEELREAGEKFGRLFSREAAQAFAMVAMALLTHTAKGFAQQVSTLPGSAQVSMQAAGQEGVLLSEVGAVESVAVTADGFTVALAPGAVAMAANGGRGDRTREAPHRNHREQEVLVARRPVDPSVREALRQGGNAAAGR